MATKKPENLTFEEAMAELSAIVGEMEKGELALEQSLKQFERGVQLAAVSSQKLESAQQKVKILMGEGDNATPVDFNE